MSSKHAGIKNDEWNKQDNIKNGHNLCENCGGTGNEFYSMYKQCTVCRGSGVKTRANPEIPNPPSQERDKGICYKCQSAICVCDEIKQETEQKLEHTLEHIIRSHPGYCSKDTERQVEYFKGLLSRLESQQKKIEELNQKILDMEDDYATSDWHVDAGIIEMQVTEIATLTSRITELEETIKFGTVSHERLADEETKVYFLQSCLKICESALEKYGKHKQDCQYIMSVIGGYDETSKCSCGFDNALVPNPIKPEQESG